MAVFSIVALRCLAVLAVVSLVSFAAVSVVERERRAGFVASILAFATGTLLFSASFLPVAGRLTLLAVITGFALILVIAWFLPIGRSIADGGQPSDQTDERDIMFARARLRPGTAEYDSYYSMRPENKKGDDHTRSLPGIESPEADKAEPVAFAATAASFSVTDVLAPAIDGPVAKEKFPCTKKMCTDLIKDLALYFGAHSVGITELKAAHIYSHIGREEGRYGEAIELDHTFAIAFSVEMDHRMMASSPEAPALMESARQYANAALIAIQIAGTLRALGFPALAHIDKRYRIIAPLVARDAGLGEIGRMGLLMTPSLGPRIRLGIITTDAPLIPDPPGNNLSILDFCTICKKCATNCPTQSIPNGDRERVGEHGLRWRIDADTCFRYWNVIGTDCGRCMAVCPYSHPNNAAHNVVRWAIARSGAARRALLALDDLFYGRQPATQSKTSGHIPYR